MSDAADLAAGADASGSLLKTRFCCKLERLFTLVVPPNFVGGTAYFFGGTQLPYKIDVGGQNGRQFGNLWYRLNQGTNNSLETYRTTLRIGKEERSLAYFFNQSRLSVVSGCSAWA